MLMNPVRIELVIFCITKLQSMNCNNDRFKLLKPVGIKLVIRTMSRLRKKKQAKYPSPAVVVDGEILDQFLA